MWGSKLRPTRFLGVKTDWTLRASTRITALRWSKRTLHSSDTRIDTVKTDIPKFYKPPTCFAKVNGTSPSLLQALRGSKRTPISFAKVKTNSYTLFGDQNAIIHVLHESKRTVWASTSLQHALRWSKRILQSSTRLTHALRLSKRTLRTFTSLIHALL